MEQHIYPLKIHGLSGRVLKLKPINKNATKKILFIYGVHTSIERCTGFAQDLNSYGSVVMPDLPGLGGMDSFYQINQKPSLDNYADYIANFIKSNYKKDEKIIIFGMSLGFLLATRTLQKYPELSNNVNFVIGLNGLLCANNLKFNKLQTKLLIGLSSVVEKKYISKIYDRIFLNKVSLRLISLVFSQKKLKGKTPAQKSEIYEFEARLWRTNDTRTYMALNKMFCQVNLGQTIINTSVYHIFTHNDQWIDHNSTQKNIKSIYKNSQFFEIDSEVHAPSINATKEDVTHFIPSSLRKILDN